MQKKLITNLGLIWFGAAISIAEILTGTLLAPLGFAKGILANLIGHIIGCCLLFFAGLIGAKTQQSSMDTTAISFGKYGSVLFSVLNVIQLIGWTAVMIISGAKGIVSLAIRFNLTNFLCQNYTWCIVISILIALWIIIGIKNLNVLNYFVVGALFILTILISFVVFKTDKIISKEIINLGELSFGQGVELAIAMPLSWLPLISDYTKDSQKPILATSVCSIVYFIGSFWMYTIGLATCIFTGSTDITQILFNAGFGIIAIIIVILSTVTTTFLDVYSGGLSFFSITKKIKQKYVALIICFIGMILAIYTPIEQYENFLYFIGSVFAPMISILITDYFIIKKSNSKTKLDIANIVLWFIGFVLYRLFMNIDTPIGNTTIVIIIVSILCLIKSKILKGKNL